MEKTTLENCLAMMDEDVHESIKDSIKKYDSIGLLVFENVDLSSHEVGHRFVIGYGPQNTLAEPPIDGKCRVTPPNGKAWQYRLKAYS